jgi:hypothetical protein
LIEFSSVLECGDMSPLSKRGHVRALQFPVDNFFLPGNFTNSPSGLGALLRNFSSLIVTDLGREFRAVSFLA